MAKKEALFKGKTADQLKQLSLKEVAPLLPSRARRKITRGFTDEEKTFLKNLQASSKPVKTHCRDMVILPEMVGKTIKIHRGNTFEDVIIQLEMVGGRLGEYALSRKKAKHADSGVSKNKKVSVRK